MVRRYCAANGLNRLGTLTYAPPGCFDPLALRADVARFFRRLRSEVGQPIPYLWVAEWHPKGHGLHVHFGLGQFVHWSIVERCWGHGFVKMKLLSDVPIRAGSVAEARIAARYLAKYTAKTLDGATGGLHRYEVAQGFQPRSVVFERPTSLEALDAAADYLGAGPSVLWFSRDEDEWAGAPAVWAQWDD